MNDLSPPPARPGVRSEPCLGEGGLDCGDGSCVSEDARCDGFQDCQMTGKDEEDCGKSSDHARNTNIYR